MTHQLLLTIQKKEACMFFSKVGWENNVEELGYFCKRVENREYFQVTKPNVDDDLPICLETT